MQDEYGYLDDLADDTGRAGSPVPPSADQAPSPPGADDYFAQPMREAAPEGTPPGSASAPGPPRAVTPPRPAAPSPPRARPQSNRLGPVALFCGTVGLLLGWVLPWFVLLILITAGAGIIVGAMTVRHSVDTGAPGRWLGLGGIVTGLLGAGLMIAGLFQAGQQARQTGSEFAGLVGGMQALADAAEVRSLTLPGTGMATLTLDTTVVQVPLDGCGLDEPAPGVALAGHGRVDQGRAVELAFRAKSLGASEGIVIVNLGSDSYLLRGSGELFQREGDSVVVTGEFSEIGTSTRITGRVEATCSAS